jgi:hypothetical protein
MTVKEMKKDRRDAGPFFQVAVRRLKNDENRSQRLSVRGYRIIRVKVGHEIHAR